jgi:polysaccharide pyruvyl transferase WcaK-like protein
MSEPKIVLTGTYSSYNKGDAAMEISTGQQIQKNWPNAEIIINAPFPQYDTDFYNEFKVIKSTRRNLVYGTLQVLRARLYYLSDKYLKLDLKWIVNNEELVSFRDADLVVYHRKLSKCNRG